LDKSIILTAALALAETLGYRGVFKRHIAAHLKIGMGTVNYHWGTMDELRGAIVREAIATGNRQIVTQAVALRDPLVWRKNLSPALRLKLDALGITVAA
jgi:AcrR family transcriptional regulator